MAGSSVFCVFRPLQFPGAAEKAHPAEKPLEVPRGRHPGSKGRRPEASTGASSGRSADPRQLYKEGYTTQFTGPIPGGDSHREYVNAPETGVRQETMQFSPPEHRDP